MEILLKSYEDMFDELDRELRRLSDETLMHMFRLPGSEEVWSPRVDVYETSDTLVVKVAAAGLRPNEIEVSLSADNKHLTVRGVRTETSGDRKGRIRYYQMEIYFGPFERIVPLPPHVKIDKDRLNASYDQGFLKITLPKLAEDAEKVRRVVPVGEE